MVSAMPPSKTDIKDRAGRLARFAADTVLETLWPTRCAICDAPGSVLCATCAHQLPFIDANRACPRCGAPFGSNQCTECNETMLAASGREALPVDGMAHALLADDAVRRIVTVYKDQNERRLAHEMALITARFIPPEWREATMTFIPATDKARRRRGFDHAELIARELAKASSMPCTSLFAHPESLDQRKLGRHARKRNMEGLFSLLPDARTPDEALIVDDVCTTGATLFAAAEHLRAQGTRRIYALTFAKVLAT